MKMRKLFWFFGLLLMNVSLIHAEIITDKQGLTVNAADVDDLLKSAPVPAQLNLIKNREHLLEKIKEVYLSKAVAKDSKTVPLSSEEQMQLDKVVEVFYFKRRLKQLVTEGLPDFEPLAKLNYDANKSKLINPEKIGVEQILITIKNRTDKEAQKLADEVVKQTKQGKDFAALVEKYSEDPKAKQNKGKLGLFAKGEMIKEFEDVAFGLKLNEVSKPVQTKYGYHILRKYESKPAAPKTFAEAKEELIGKIRTEYVKNRMDEYYAKVKNDNAMTLNDTALDSYIAEKTKKLEELSKTVEAPVTSNSPATVGQ